MPATAMGRRIEIVKMRFCYQKMLSGSEARLNRVSSDKAFRFVDRPQPILPDKSSIVNQRLTLVESGVRKWACLRCLGSREEVINLSLHPNQRPRWTVSEDFWMRPSIYHSVHQKNECGCHFWIKKGLVYWCKRGLPKNQMH